MWKLHSLSVSYGARPSSFFGLAPTSWEAYQLDLCALQVGRWIENKLNERDDKGKPIHTLGQLLDEEEQKPATEFRSMAGLVTRKMAIPESGIW